jgi:glycosyltransferase involved in cell wall biosynthesis
MLINGRFLTRPATGVDRFALELLRALGRQGALQRARMVLPEGAALRTAVPSDLPVHRHGRRHGHAWEQIDLARLARTERLVNLCNTAPLALRRQTVVLHDAAVMANPANYGRAFRAWYRVMMGTLLRRADTVVTVSRFSADELRRHFGVPTRAIEVLPEGGEHILREPADGSVLERLALDGRRFVLAVGSQSRNKNFAAVLAAMEQLEDPDVLLVAVGGGDARIYAGAALEHPRLRRTGYVTDAQLRALYEAAACFAFPSFYEGFGLPPLEAMNCGCPVIVSDRASLPEVCQDAALYCNPDDPATLAAQLRRLLASSALRETLAAKGRHRAAQLTWDAAARDFLDLEAARA